MTSFHHQPEAQHPKSSAIHKKRRPITPSIGPKQTWASALHMSAYDPKRTMHDAVAKRPHALGMEILTSTRGYLNLKKEALTSELRRR